MSPPPAGFFFEGTEPPNAENPGQKRRSAAPAPGDTRGQNPPSGWQISPSEPPPGDKTPFQLDTRGDTTSPTFWTKPRRFVGRYAIGECLSPQRAAAARGHQPTPPPAHAAPAAPARDPPGRAPRAVVDCLTGGGFLRLEPSGVLAQRNPNPTRKRGRRGDPVNQMRQQRTQKRLQTSHSTRFTAAIDESRVSHPESSISHCLVERPRGTAGLWRFDPHAVSLPVSGRC